MRLLHLHRPHLPLELARARASEPFPPGPLVLGGRPWDPGPVIDASPEARALGVRRGMPLGSAHRLAPEATFIDPDPDADRATVEAAFEALAAFSPGIAGSADPLDAAFGLFEVQVDGLEALWGPEPVLVGRSDARRSARATGAAGRRPPGRDRRDALRGDRGGRPRPARGARSSSRRAARPPSSPRTRPACSPRIADVRARLTRFGLRRIGPVAELARSALVARFGEEGARIHARARGEELEPFRPRRAPERLRARPCPIEPAGRGSRAAPVRPPPAGRRPDRAARRARAGGVASPAPPRPGSRLRPAGTPAELDVEQRFPEPTAEAEAIERLLFARLERTPPPAAVARLELELDGTAPAAGQQLPLFTPQAARGARLDWQLAQACPDVRRGPRPAGGDHRSGGAASRDALGVAIGRLGRTGSAVDDPPAARPPGDRGRAG